MYVVYFYTTQFTQVHFFAVFLLWSSFLCTHERARGSKKRLLSMYINIMRCLKHTEYFSSIIKFRHCIMLFSNFVTV